jgi:hypothetical protein
MLLLNFSDSRDSWTHMSEEDDNSLNLPLALPFPARQGDNSCSTTWLILSIQNLVLDGAPTSQPLRVDMGDLGVYPASRTVILSPSTSNTKLQPLIHGSHCLYWAFVILSQVLARDNRIQRTALGYGPAYQVLSCLARRK